MKVLRADHYGMCFGVRDAIDIAAGIEDPTTVSIHGELVHNPIVLGEMERRGFRMMSESERGGAPPISPTVLITAHGVSDAERDRLRNAGKHLVDTTCPLVQRAHTKALRLQELGFFVVVIGKAEHVEVLGLTGDLQNYVVVESVEDVERYPHPRIGIACQTTTLPGVAQEIIDQIRAKNPDKLVRVENTICQPTLERQDALERLLPQVDALVVVGGRNSNNTKKLAEISIENGVPAFHVECAQDLELSDLEEFAVVGLTAGTSTTDEAVEEVYETLLTASPRSEAPTEKPCP